MIFKLQTRIAYCATVSAAALSFVMPSSAQEQDVERILQSVVVATKKTEESIQDVPIAVSAFDEGALEKLQLAGGPDRSAWEHYLPAFPPTPFRSRFGGTCFLPIG